jgi:hypothetical protein
MTAGHESALAREDAAIGRVQDGSRAGSERGIDGEYTHESRWADGRCEPRLVKSAGLR